MTLTFEAVIIELRPSCSATRRPRLGIAVQVSEFVESRSDSTTNTAHRESAPFHFRHDNSNQFANRFVGLGDVLRAAVVVCDRCASGVDAEVVIERGEHVIEMDWS